MAVLVQLVLPAAEPTVQVPFWAEAEEMARRKQPAKGEKNGDFFGFIVGLLDWIIVFQGLPWLSTSTHVLQFHSQGIG
jgi:hypothetical protein